MKSIKQHVTERVDVGPVSQVGPVDLSEISSQEELDEKVQELADKHDVDVDNIDREKAENVGREILSYWKNSAQAGFTASLTGNYGFFKDTVMTGRKAGILGNFKGIGTVITGIAISLGVGAIVLGKFQDQTNNSEANTILGDGLGLLQDTIGFMEIGVVMLFGVIFMRYME